jgi:hypothetical protein
MAKDDGSGLLLIGGIAAAAYFTRNSWLPFLETEFPSIFGSGSGAAGTNPTAPLTTTGNHPVTAATPGAIPVGDQGCYQYGTGTSGSAVITCPPGVNPPPTAPPATVPCQAGFTQDAAGICTMYPDAYLLANLNSVPWTCLSDIPAEQIQRIDPQILSTYATVTGINAGTVLAYLLGLGANPLNGTMMQGSDGNIYQALNSVFYRQGTATSSTLSGTPSSQQAAKLVAALPISQSVLIMASANPIIAQLVGRDQRAMLTAAQWNYYYTQATGVVQGIPLHEPSTQGALMSAEQYQAMRRAHHLETRANLGTLRPARRGAFPLGKLGLINQWVPPGNRTVYSIPGRGAVPAGRGGGPRLGLIQSGGGDHRWARSPFPRPSWWREAGV